MSDFVNPPDAPSPTDAGATHRRAEAQHRDEPFTPSNSDDTIEHLVPLLKVEEMQQLAAFESLLVSAEARMLLADLLLRQAAAEVPGMAVQHATSDLPDSPAAPDVVPTVSGQAALTDAGIAVVGRLADGAHQVLRFAAGDYLSRLKLAKPRGTLGAKAEESVGGEAHDDVSVLIVEGESLQQLQAVAPWIGGPVFIETMSLGDAGTEVVLWTELAADAPGDTEAAGAGELVVVLRAKDGEASRMTLTAATPYGVARVAVPLEDINVDFELHS